MQIRIAVVSEYQINVLTGFDSQLPWALTEKQRLLPLRCTAASLRSDSYRILFFLVMFALPTDIIIIYPSVIHPKCIPFYRKFNCEHFGNKMKLVA